MSVRGRVLAVSTAILLLTLALWSWLMIGLLDTWMERVATAHARADARLLAGELQTGQPFTLPVTSDDPVTIWQVVGPEGGVLTTSYRRADQPISELRPEPGELLTKRVDALAGIDNDPFVVVAVTDEETGSTVLVAQAMHLEELPLAATMTAVALSAAATLAIGAGLVRWSISASLTPVERMRSQLAEISHPGGSGRVTVPETGDELQRLGETLNELLARLDTSWATQRNFVSDAGHELRTPLSVIRTHVDLGADDASWQESRAAIDAETHRLQRLVDDLLTLSRVDADALPLRAADCDLDDLVVEQVRRLEPARVPIAVHVVPCRVVADPARIAQVVTNLLTNGVRHAARQVRVTVSTLHTAAGDFGQVEVDNDGPVVPVDDRKRIFGRFIRLDETRARDSGGTGIGLAIAAELTAAHGGTLTCGESPDGWCRFTLRLPVAGPPERR